jgi:hypothetical protein
VKSFWPKLRAFPWGPLYMMFALYFSAAFTDGWTRALCCAVDIGAVMFFVISKDWLANESERLRVDSHALLQQAGATVAEVVKIGMEQAAELTAARLRIKELEAKEAARG